MNQRTGGLAHVESGSTWGAGFQKGGAEKKRKRERRIMGEGRAACGLARTLAGEKKSKKNRFIRSGTFPKICGTGSTT